MHSRRPTVEYDLKLMNFSCSGKLWEYDHLRDVIKVEEQTMLKIFLTSGLNYTKELTTKS